jgi:hypothetical protein
MYSKKLFSNNYQVLIILAITAGLTLASPVMAQQAEAEAAAGAATTAVDAAADSAAATLKKAGEEDVVLDPGMQIPVDGSSLEAFNESLAKIKEQAQEANYISLEQAIKYLLVYDLGAGRDRAKLARNLDGLTGDQIIERVHWRK